MITFVTNLFPYPSMPGRGLFNLQLVSALARRGERIEVKALVAVTNPLCLQAVRAWQMSCGQVDVDYIPYAHIPLLGRSFAALSASRALAVAVGECADVIIASWLYPDGVAVCRVARQLGKPCWVMVLGSDMLHLKHYARRKQIMDGLISAAGVVCVADTLAERLVLEGVPAERVHVVRNGVDLERFCPSPKLEAEQRLADSGVVLPQGRRVLFLGNLVDVKCPDVALACMRRVCSEQVGVSFVVAGDGPMRRRLERAAEGVPVCFIGRQPYERVPDLLNASDLLLLSSRSEGMPNVVAEARACGLPVVATDVGLCRAMLDGHEKCRVVPAGDVPGLASAVSQLVMYPSDRRVAAFERSWDDMAAQMKDLLVTAIA
jgi:glycosyltransferase involved in cell wall biosynthesis